MKKLLLLILVTLGYASYTAAIAGRYNPPPATFPTNITGPVASGGTVNSSPIPITITLDRTTSQPLNAVNITVSPGILTGLSEKVILNYSTQFGTAGTGNGNLTLPNDITLDASGKRYVTDGANNRVEVFDGNGAYVSQFGSTGNGAGQLSNPYGIAVDASNNVYVADAGNNRVEIFNGLGVYSGVINTTTSGALNNPQGMYIDPATNYLYVVDSGHARLVIFDLNNAGSYIKSIGSQGSGPGQFFAPSSVVVTGGFIYVTDSGNKRVVKFDVTGVQAPTSIGSSSQFISPAGIITDGTGKIYVVDKSNSYIEMFSTNGTFMGTAAAPGTTNGALNFPTGISADKSGNIYVSDRRSNRIQVFLAKEQYTASILPGSNGPVNIAVTLASVVTDINGEKNATATYNVTYVASPASPTNLMATSLDGSYKLDWTADDPSNNIFRYKIYQGTSATNFSTTPIAVVDPTTTTYTSEVPVTNGTPIYFYVTAVNTSSKESGPSNIVSVTPKGNPVITAGTIPNKKYNDASFDIQPLLHPSSASDGAFTYSLDPSSVGATLTAPSTINIAGVGHVDVIITQNSTNTYNAATLHVGFDIDKATPQINWSPVTPIVYGTVLDASYFTATASKSGTTTPSLAGNIVYTLQPSGTPILSISNTVLPVGDNRIRADYTPTTPDDANYEPAGKTVTIHVDRATPVLAWNLDTSPNAYTYGQHFSTLPQPTVTDINGNPMTNGTFAYTFSPAVAAAPNDILSVGSQDLTVTFTPSVADATNYGTATLTKTIHIGKASQTISQVEFPTPVYGNAPFSIATLASTDSGLPLTYTVSGKGTYDAVTKLVTITGAGDINVIVSQPGNGSYSAATPLSITITVDRAVPIISWSLQTSDHYGLKAADLVQPTAAGIGNTPLTGGTFTYSYSPSVTGPTDPFAVGLQSLTAYYSPSSANAVNYKNTAQLTKTIQIDQASQTIAPATLTKTYGNAPFSIANLTSSSSGLEISYAYVSGPGTYDAATKILTITGAGDIVVTASQSGNINYTAATPVNITIHVDRATPGLTWAVDLGYTYGEKASQIPAPVATDINGNPMMMPAGSVAYEYTPSVAAVPNDVFAAGNQTLNATFTPSGADATNYGPAVITKTTVIGKATQHITQLEFPTPVYGNAPFSIATLASTDSGLPLTYTVSGQGMYDAVTKLVTITGAGDINIIVSQNGNGSYSIATDLPITITVAKAAPSISWSLPSPKDYGTKLSDLVSPVATGVGGIPITGTYTYFINPSTAITTGTVLPVGNLSVRAHFVPSGANYSEADQSSPITIGIAPQTLSVNTIPTEVYGYAPFNINSLAKSTSNLQPTYTLISGPATFDAATNTITITGAGDIIVTAHQAGNGNYSAANPVDITIPVGRATPGLIWAVDPDYNYGEKASQIPAPVATDINNNPMTMPAGSVVYEYTPSVAAAPNDVFATGNQTLKATFTPSGADATNYGPAMITKTTLIGKVSQTISYTAIQNKHVGDPAFDVVAALNAHASSNLGIDSYSLVAGSTGATLSGNTLTITGTGTVTIAIKQNGNSTYSAVEQDVSFNILPAPATPVSQTISYTAIQNKYVGDPAFDVVAALNAHASSNLGIDSYSLVAGSTGATLSGNTLTITGTGTVTIAIKQNGNSTYSAVEQDVSFNILPAPATPVSQTISYTAIQNKYVGDPAFDVVAALNAHASSNLGIDSYSLVAGSTGATLSGNTLTITGIGTVTIAIKQNGNSTYSAVEQDVSFNILPAPATPVSQTISYTAIQNKAYGDAPFDIVAALNARTSSGLAISSYSLLPTSTGATLSGNMLTITGVGTVKIAIVQNGSANYSQVEQDVQFDIVKANQTITIAGTIPDKAVNSPVFDIAATPVTATASSRLPVNYSIVSGPASMNGTRITLTGGTGLVTVGFNQAGNTNYNAAPQATLTFNVNKLSQTLTVTGSIPDKTYGDAPFNWRTIPVTATASSGLPIIATIASGPATISGNIITITGAGTVTVSFSQAGNTVYDAATDQKLTFKVNPLTPVLTWTNPTVITYGTALGDQQLYASANVPGTFTYSPAAGTVLHAGSNQPLSVTFTPTDAVNYNVVTKNVAITVNKVAVNVSVSDISRPYNQPNPDFAINYSGFVNGDTQANLATPATASTTATIASLVGTYPITVNGAVSNDYTFRYVNATLTITTIGRNLTFNALPVKTYGDPDFDAGATATSGEPIIYTSSNTAVATIVNGQIHIVGAGYATITASLPVNPDYNTTPSISQFMVVNKAAQTIDFANIPVQLRGTTYDLSNIKSSSGLPVTFTTNDPMIASINGLTVSSLRVGITGIVANQAGDTNYYAANTVVRNLEVKDVNREVIVHPAVSPNGDGINDVLYIEGINEHPDNRVTIINRNGVRVYEINGYDNTNKFFDGRSNFTGAKQQAGTYFYLVEYVVNGVGRHLTGYFVLKYD